VPSVALSLAAVLTTIYALKRMAEHGVAWGSVALLLAGIAIGVAFVRRQKLLPYPLLELKLFRSAAFSAAIAAYALTCLAMFGMYVFITQYLQLLLGLSPLRAGLATLPWALAFIVGSLLAPRLARSVPRLAVMTWGLAAAALGMGLLAAVDGRFALPLLIAGTVIMSLGMAPVFTIGNEMIITAAPPERAGAASALSETASEFSGAVGIALIGSAGTVVYRHGLGDTMPAGVTGATAEAALATIGGAVAGAAALPAPLGAALLDAARVAFGDALQFAALIGAATLVLAAVLAAWMLREPPAAQALPEPEHRAR
jgi:DHA2 family multidrug resistance protein-like MFS transporter